MLISVYKHLKGECKDSKARRFSTVPSDRTRGDGHKWKHTRFPLNIRRHGFTVRVTEHWHVAQRGGGLSLPGDTQKMPGHGPEQPTPAGPAPDDPQASLATSTIL